MQFEMKHSLLTAAVCCAFFGSSVQACNMASKLAHPSGAALSITLPQALQAEPAKPEVDGPHTIVGMWKVDTTIGSTLIDQGFDSFYGDGNELIVDISPPATDNVCTGVWEKTDHDTYKLNHPAWDFDLNGNLLYVVVFHETMTLDRHGNSFTGTAYVDTYDLMGNLVATSPVATLKATRIKVSSSPL